MQIKNSPPINYYEIIDNGLKINNNIKDLQKWYNSNIMIEFATYTGNTITLKFIDGTFKLILDVFSNVNNKIFNSNKEKIEFEHLITTNNDKLFGNSAQLLNPSEYLYGNIHIKRILNNLINHGFNVEYVYDQDVDIPYIKNNLYAEIIYMNTHAGFWDIDGDQQGDCVVIGTGEHWTEETKTLYPFEYENKMIVEGLVGEQSFVCFTPDFITYYYSLKNFSSSLIYMATCHATYDDSMANAFLDSGASVYMGWTQNTVFWINSKTSVRSFRLLNLGLNVHQTCNIIRYGGLLNFLFQSKLTYYGDGNHKISTN